MSYLLTCPHCGVREVTDFSFGGEVVVRPKSTPTERELNTYNYFRANVAGDQVEWWWHRSGCRAWFLAERDTRSNVVHRTWIPDTEAHASPAPELPGAGAGAGAEGTR